MQLKATPELEDFGHKYTEEGQGFVGAKLLDRYFASVKGLLAEQGKLDGRTKQRAIELGCGEGYSTVRIRNMLPKTTELQASEYVEKLIPTAKKLNPSVNIRQESVYDLTHKDSTFDIVFLLEVLEHLDYPDKALQEISRVMKDDGVLILGVPREPLWRSLNMLRGKYLKDFGNTVGHLNHWSTGGLTRYVEQHFGKVISKRTPMPWTIVAANKKHAK